MGEPFRISFASSSYVVGSYKLGAAAPPGLSLSPNVKEFGVGTVEGIPSRAGVYNMDIFAYEEDNLTGDSTLLALTIYILEKGPTITDHPNSVSLQWGSALSLSVSVENTTGVTYQWQKNGQDILGTTDASYDVSSVTSLDAGLYQVVVGKDGETKVSDLASISVMASGIEMWKEQEFEDPFGQMADPLSDPDIDGFNNLFEYSIGSDPEKSTTQQIPSIESEDSFMGEFVVYKFPKNPNASDLTVSAEFSDGLSPANWTPIFDLLNGIRVIETVSELKIKVPKDTTCFIRFRVLGPAIN
ncbi:MAG: immunoglobulin domain-containing protein [Verrucomicrobia bacterium]|nr:immunoglobulin domain-containing protein [Verrucomicrobiota bacterium]MDA1065706.1 immunoglobulin domain-containing protein [Verrucomicrobiota bacterium]